MLCIKIEIDAAIFIDSKFKFVYGTGYFAHSNAVDINTILSPLTTTTFSLFTAFCFTHHISEKIENYTQTACRTNFAPENVFIVFQKYVCIQIMIGTRLVYVFD